MIALDLHKWFIAYKELNSRDAYQQAEVGTTLSFIEESEAGDLAFFDNEEGKIIHVGIILGQLHHTCLWKSAY